MAFKVKQAIGISCCILHVKWNEDFGFTMYIICLFMCVHSALLKFRSMCYACSFVLQVSTRKILYMYL